MVPLSEVKGQMEDKPVSQQRAAILVTLNQATKNNLPFQKKFTEQW